MVFVCPLESLEVKPFWSSKAKQTNHKQQVALFLSRVLYPNLPHCLQGAAAPKHILQATPIAPILAVSPVGWTYGFSEELPAVNQPRLWHGTNHTGSKSGSTSECSIQWWNILFDPKPATLAKRLPGRRVLMARSFRKAICGGSKRSSVVRSKVLIFCLVGLKAYSFGEPNNVDHMIWYVSYLRGSHSYVPARSGSAQPGPKCQVRVWREAITKKSCGPNAINLQLQIANVFKGNFICGKTG